MKKDTLPKFLKTASDLKDKVTKGAKGAVEKASLAKKVVAEGVKTSRAALDKTTQVVTKKNISQGIDVTLKGVDMAVKGARIASRGVDALANSVEKAAHNAKTLSKKLKD